MNIQNNQVPRKIEFKDQRLKGIKSLFLKVHILLKWQNQLDLNCTVKVYSRALEK